MHLMIPAMLSFLFLLAPPSEDETVILVDAGITAAEVSPTMYGVFLEEINHTFDGGLYPELIRNRGFEDHRVPEGATLDGDHFTTPNGWTYPFGASDPLPAWYLVTEGPARGTIEPDLERPLNAAGPTSLRLHIEELGSGRAGAANTGFSGIALQKGECYELAFSARASPGYPGGLKAVVEDQAGNVLAESLIQGVEEEWRRFSCRLIPSAGEVHARFVVQGLAPGTIWFDAFSLMPRKTWNGLRPDLAERLCGLKPGFLRFPGGCFVEGMTLANAYRWKETIGPVEERPGHWCLWGYRSSDGFGFHEYFTLCENLGCPPLLVVNCGMSCQARKGEVADGKALDRFIRDALDAVEYAVGSAESEWGGKRAAAGHPEPFDLKYVEIGNENFGPDYEAIYPQFHRALKAAYPGIVTIANTYLPDAPLEIVDEHYFETVEWFVKNAGRFDGYDRKGPRVYVGEYAVRECDGAGRLAGAVAEAAFTAGMERNADIVVMTSYAPSFLSIDDVTWFPDLVYFDRKGSCCFPSYYMRKLFAEFRPDVIVPAVVSDVPGDIPASWRERAMGRGLHVVSGRILDGSRVIVKVINISGNAVEAEVQVSGMGGGGFEGRATCLTSDDPMDTNLPGSPDKVIPVTLPLTTEASTFSYRFPACSITILDLSSDS